MPWLLLKWVQVPFKNWASLKSPTHSLLDILVFFFTLSMYFVLRTSILEKGFGKKLNPRCDYFSIISVFCGPGLNSLNAWSGTGKRCTHLSPASAVHPSSGESCMDLAQVVSALGAFTVLTPLRGYQRCLSESISSVLALHHHGLPARQSFKFSPLAPNLGFFSVPPCLPSRQAR